MSESSVQRYRSTVTRKLTISPHINPKDFLKHDIVRQARFSPRIADNIVVKLVGLSDKRAAALANDSSMRDGVRDDEREHPLRHLAIPLSMKIRVLPVDRRRAFSKSEGGDCCDCLCCFPASSHSKASDASSNASPVVAHDPMRNQISVVSAIRGEGVASYFLLLRNLFFINLIPVVLLLSFVIIPQLIDSKSTLVVNASQPPCNGLSWLSADCFSTSLLFYGFYEGDALASDYNMRYAYVFVVIAYFVYLLFALGISLYQAARRNTGVSDSEHSLREYVFVCWPYYLSNVEGIRLFLNRNIMHVYQSLPTSKRNDVCMNIWRVMSISLTLIMIGLACVGLSWICGIGNFSSPMDYANTLNNHIIVYSGIVATANAILPTIFAVFVRTESYQFGNYSSISLLIRSMLLRFALTTVLIYFYIDQWKKRDRQNVNITAGGDYICTDTLPACDCIETFIGQIFYSLILFSFLYIIMLSLVLEWFPALLARLGVFKRNPFFDIGRNTLELIYLYVLCWLSTFFYPFASITVLLMSIVIFYWKYFTVHKFCRSAIKRWDTVRMHTVNQGILLLSLLGCFMPFFYVVTALQPSTKCGVYSNSTVPVLDEIFPDISSQIQTTSLIGPIFRFFNQPGTLVFLFFLLLVLIYFAFIYLKANKSVERNLTAQFDLMESDRKFLKKELHLSNEKTLHVKGEVIGRRDRRQRVEVNSSGQII